MKAKAAQLTREHNERAWLAYTMARLQRAKKIPPLRKLLLRDPSRKAQSWQDMKAVTAQWAIALGGEIKPKEGS